MTVTTDVQSIVYDTDGSTADFPIPFYFLRAADITAELVDAVDNLTDLVLGTDFTVTGAGQPSGGVLSATAAFARGYKLHIYRVVPVTQESQYQQNDPFPAKTTEKALDKLTMLVQQQKQTTDRALVVPRSDLNPQTTLPSARLRANKALGFDAAGNPFAIDLTISSLIAPVVNSIDMLRLVSKFIARDAFVTSYHGGNYKGGGAYRVDLLDNSSDDNGCTIIVAADGGRWKLQLTGPVTLDHCGTYGDGVTNDTAAVKRWVAYGESGGMCAGSVGVFRVTEQIVVDWGRVPERGGSFLGCGLNSTLFDLSEVSTAPAWLMKCSAPGGKAFYGKFKDFGFKGNCAGPVFQVGLDDQSDQFNEFKIDVQVNNSHTGPDAVAIKLNSLYNPKMFIVGNCNGHGTSAVMTQVQFGDIFGSLGNSDTALRLTGGYIYGNVFHAMDLEVVNTCLMIDGDKVVNNKFEGGQFVWDNGSGPPVAMINATAGNGNVLECPNIASPGNITAPGGDVGITIDNTGIGGKRMGYLVVSPAQGDGFVTINADAAHSAGVAFQMNGKDRWRWARDSSGNLLLNRHDATGAFVDTPWYAEPSAGHIRIQHAFIPAIGLFGHAVTDVQPVITGSRANTASMISQILNALASFGAINDQTTP